MRPRRCGPGRGRCHGGGRVSHRQVMGLMNWNRLAAAGARLAVASGAQRAAVAARGAHQAAQLLRVGVGVGAHPAGQRVVVGDQLGAPALGLVQLPGCPARSRAGGATASRSGSASTCASACRCTAAGGACLRASACACGTVDGVAQRLGHLGGRAGLAGRATSSGPASAGRATAASAASCWAIVVGVRRRPGRSGRRCRGAGHGPAAWSCGKAVRGKGVAIIVATLLPRLPTRGPCPMPHPHEPPSHASGFAFNRDQFQQMVEDTLAQARQLGASDAGVEVSEGVGLSVSVRKGELENVERNRDKSLGVSVYLGQRRGNASTSDFSPAAMRRRCRRPTTSPASPPKTRPPACPMPTTWPRPTVAPASTSTCSTPGRSTPSRRRRAGAALRRAALATSRQITNSEGAGVSAQQSHFWAGNSRGFRGGYASSRHYVSVSPIAGRGRGMQRDSWYSVDARRGRPGVARGGGPLCRRARAVAPEAAPRAHRRVPVLFESTVAAGLLGSLVQATSAARCTARPAS
jgi:hypothetical protein